MKRLLLSLRQLIERGKKEAAVCNADSGFFGRTVLVYESESDSSGASHTRQPDQCVPGREAAPGQSSAERRRVLQLASGPKTVLCLAECKT